MTHAPACERSDPSSGRSAAPADIIGIRGYAFVADADAHRTAFSHRTSYSMFVDDARDQIDWNPDWSRRGRAVPTYTALRQLGLPR